MASTEINKKEIFEITTVLKGMAIILVVAFHVFFALKDRTYYATCYYLRPFRMPVFMFVSGYLYTMITRDKYNSLKPLAYEKFKRLLLPMFFLQIVGAVENTLIDLWRFDAVDSLKFSLKDFVVNALIYPQASFNGYLWFVYVLFLIFIVAHVFRRYPIVLFAVGLGLYFVPMPLMFDLNNFRLYLQYFALGMATFHYLKSDYLKLPSWVFLLVIIAGIAVNSYYFRYTPWTQRDDSFLYLIRSYSGLFVMLSLAVLLTRFRVAPARWLARIGGYSASIYFLHMPFYYILTVYILNDGIVLKGLELWGYSLLTIVVGIGGPILLDKYLISKNQFLGMLLVGRKGSFVLKEWLSEMLHRLHIVTK